MRRLRSKLSDSDSGAISVPVQLELDLPTGAELGNMLFIIRNTFLGTYELPVRHLFHDSETNLLDYQSLMHRSQKNLGCFVSCFISWKNK